MAITYNIGPFRPRVSTTAEKVDHSKLDMPLRHSLIGETDFNPLTHNIYRFFLQPVSIGSTGTNLSRKEKKQAYETVDRVIIHVDRSTPELVFLGIHPTSQSESGVTSLDFQGKALVEVTVPKIFRTKLTGQVKNWLKRKDKPSVIASRTDAFIQWIFCKHWIEKGQQIRLQILCILPKSLEPGDTFVKCSAKFMDRGREITKVTRVPVRIPKQGS